MIASPSRYILISTIALALGATANPARADYEPNKYTDPDTGEILEYNLYVPDNYDGQEKLPLLLCMHAANNTNPPNRTLSSEGKCYSGSFMDYRSFFVIPISQTNAGGWGDAGPNSPITQEQKFEGRLAVVVIKQLLEDARYNIDADRLYITGPSMGARGTWDIIRRNPDMFAAAMPMAAPAAAVDAPLYINQNIWAVNGENDSTANDNQDAIDAIRALGGNPIYTELSGHGHDSWRTIYPLKAFVDWVYAQRRGVPWWSHEPGAPTSFGNGESITADAAAIPPDGLDPLRFPNGSGAGGMNAGGAASNAGAPGDLEGMGGMAQGVGGAANGGAATTPMDTVPAGGQAATMQTGGQPGEPPMDSPEPAVQAGGQPGMQAVPSQSDPTGMQAAGGASAAPAPVVTSDPPSQTVAPLGDANAAAASDMPLAMAEDTSSPTAVAPSTTDQASSCSYTAGSTPKSGSIGGLFVLALVAAGRLRRRQTPAAILQHTRT